MAKAKPARPADASRRPLARPAEVADYLDKTVKTLANWRSKKIGPQWVKCGHEVLYDWADVDEWVRSGKKGRAAA